MKISIRNIDINYIQYGKGEDVLLLHGWGQNIAMMDPLGKQIINKRITIIDLPGFGDTNEPTEVLTIYDYNSILEEFCTKLKIKNPTIIAHSFGGRIAIIYASLNSVNKLILLASPGIVHKTKESMKVKLLKKLKKIPVLNKLENFAKKHIGSTDYKNASTMMRKILVNTVNQDLTKELSQIKCPTLLIWGENDTQVDIETAKEMEKIIPDAALISFPNATHYAYLEYLPNVSVIVNNFIKE